MRGKTHAGTLPPPHTQKHGGGKRKGNQGGDEGGRQITRRRKESGGGRRSGARTEGPIVSLTERVKDGGARDAELVPLTEKRGR